MLPIYAQLTESLTQLAVALEQVPAGLIGIAHGSWSFPAVSRDDWIREVRDLISAISTRPLPDVSLHQKRLQQCLEQIGHLQSTIPYIWGNAGHGVQSFVLTFASVRIAVEQALLPYPGQEAATRALELVQKIKDVERKLKAAETLVTTLDATADRISNAKNLADEIFKERDDIETVRKDITGVQKDVSEKKKDIANLHESAESLDEKLSQLLQKADSVMSRAESAYSAATTVGLAASFSERENSLKISSRAWVIGLILALMVAGWIAFDRLHKLSDLLAKTDLPLTILIPNIIFSFLSVGGPVWFASIATKRINSQFKLAEDYAFKAAVARAYEGFRREAEKIDHRLEAHLLASALTRLDEQPLRLVDHEPPPSAFQGLADMFASSFKLPQFAKSENQSSGDSASGSSASGK